MTRVKFSVISSPLLAIYTPHEHARKCKAACPEASDEILRNNYVDGLASGKDGVYEAIKLHRPSAEVMEQAAFNLMKWSSNSSVVMKAIPSKDRASKCLVSLQSDPAGVYPATKAWV